MCSIICLLFSCWSSASLFYPLLKVGYWSLQLLLLDCTFLFSTLFLLHYFGGTVIMYICVYNSYSFLMGLLLKSVPILKKKSKVGKKEEQITGCSLPSWSQFRGKCSRLLGLVGCLQRGHRKKIIKQFLSPLGQSLLHWISLLSISRLCHLDCPSSFWGSQKLGMWWWHPRFKP